MLLKTNKREEVSVLLVGYVIEKKLLRQIIRRIQSILVNIQEIIEKSTADERQITDFSSAKCERMRLKHEFSRRPAPMRVCDAAGHSLPAPHRRKYTLLRHPLLQTCGWRAPLFLCMRPLAGDVNCAYLVVGWLP
jgi:hypothetical protein